MPAFIWTFLCIVVSGIETISSDDLQVAVAALEERLTSLPTIEVVFNTHYEWAPGHKDSRNKLLADSTTTWIRAGDKQYYSYALKSDPTKPIHKWVYDGRSTHEWIFRNGGQQPKDVFVGPGPPRQELFMQNMLALNLGLVIHGHSDGLNYFLQLAKQNGTLTASRNGRLVEVTFGQQIVNGVTGQLFINLEAEQEYQIASWRVEEQLRPNTAPHRVDFTVEEFQQIVDEHADQIWFPKRARITSNVTIVRIEVESARINYSTQENRLNHQEPPFGAILHQMSMAGGGKTERSIVGGDAAHQKQIEQLSAEAKREIARLEKDGVAFNGSPQPSQVVGYWFLGCVMLLLIATLCWSLRSKK